MGKLIAGRMYDLFCIASIAEGIQSTPIFSWLDSSGYEVGDGDGITVGPPTTVSLPLEFSFLRESHSGTYTCSVTLYSLTLKAPLTTTISVNMSVQRKQIIIIILMF